MGLRPDRVLGCAFLICHSPPTICRTYARSRSRIKQALDDAADAFGNALGNAIVGHAKFQDAKNNLSSYGEMHYEGATQKGATPAQALATAQSAEAMQERAIERMLAGGDAGPLHATSADLPSDEMSAAAASANAAMDALNQDRPDSGTASRTGSSADPLLGTTTDKLSPYIQRAPASSQLTEYIRRPDLSIDQSQSNAADPIDVAFEVGGNASDAVGLLFGAIDRKMLNGGVSFSMNTWSKSHWPIDDMRLVFAEPGRFHPWLATDTTFHYGSFADEATYSWDFSGTKTGRMLAGTFDAVGLLPRVEN